MEQMRMAYYDNYFDYCTAIESLAEELKEFFSRFQGTYRLQIKQYPLYRFETRVKSWESILHKIKHRGEYKNVTRLDEIRDILGVCIIVELDEDVENVVKLFEKEKTALYALSHISSLVHSPTRHANGKLTHHYDGVYSLKGKDSMTNFKFEIQVKSEVENLWSNIEHMSFYKNRVKSRNERILNRLKEHSYNLLMQADDVLSILRREKMKNDLFNLKEKLWDALEGVFVDIKIREVEAVSGYLYQCWALPFDDITVEELENIFLGGARVRDSEVRQVLEDYVPLAEYERVYHYLKNNLALSDIIVLKIGISSNEPQAAIEYLLSDMEEARCIECGKWVNYDDADFFATHVEMRGDFYCRDCAESFLYYCTSCGIMTPGKLCTACSSRQQNKR